MWRRLFAILTLVECIRTQETLSCGQTTYQVSFEPTRPVLATGGTARYTYQRMDLLFGADTQVCNLSANPAVYDPKLGPLINTLETRLVITYCENCTRCMNQLPYLHRMATRIATDAGLQSLLIIVRSPFEGMKIDNTMVKFVQITEEPELSNVCELVDSVDGDALRSFSKTSVLFVSISFIILMVISLAWLVFYYVQRFRYAHAKDRLQRRLFNAAKKALTRIPTKPVKAGDKELDSDCPVCIDPYRAGDIVRMLPCRHVFHKTCVDPWLLEHRTCPMCKSDILKAFGYQINMTNRRRAQFSAPNDDQHVVHTADSDHLSVDANSTASESNAYPFPVVSEIHDPFSFTPSTSPQLVQVMHATNARGFSIIPLTVHSGNQTNPATANFTTVNAAVERHPGAQVISSTGDIMSTSSGSSSSGGRMTSSRRKNRGHVVNLVHVRSRSLSNAQPPPANITKVQVEHHERPTALFRTAPAEKSAQSPENPTIVAESPPAVVQRPATVGHRVPQSAGPTMADHRLQFHSATAQRPAAVQSDPRASTTVPFSDTISVESL